MRADHKPSALHPCLDRALCDITRHQGTDNLFQGHHRDDCYIFVAAAVNGRWKTPSALEAAVAVAIAGAVAANMRQCPLCSCGLPFVKIAARPPEYM